MPKRKRPVTDTGNLASKSSTPQSSRNLIRQFHALLKKQTQLKSQTQDTACTRALIDVERDMERLGGLSAYQRMSSIGQGNDRGGGSEKVLIGWLKEMGVSNREGKGKLRLLEVGALKPDNYRSCASWMASIPIDLQSRHPSIKEQDFLLMDKMENFENWDVISLSLVLNFVPDPRDRGRMLCLAHNMLSSGGLLFLALPLPCVENSRYLTFAHLRALMHAINFIEIKGKWKKGGKMVYWLYQKTAQDNTSDQVFDQLKKKVVFRQATFIPKEMSYTVFSRMIQTLSMIGTHH